MIEGAVNAAYEPVITLAVRGPAGQAREMEAVIDASRTGLMTVTPALAADLGLDLRGTGRTT